MAAWATAEAQASGLGTRLLIVLVCLCGAFPLERIRFHQARQR